MSGTNPGELLIGPALVGEDAGDGDAWIVDRRHEDGEHWVELQRHPSEAAAREGLEEAVRSGIARQDLRIRRLDPSDEPED
jgi:hypothetical protein